MNYLYIKDFKFRQRRLDSPKFLSLEKVEKHRLKFRETSNEISQILRDGNEIIGIDCEMFEFDHSKTTEVGIGRLTKQGLLVEHIIISDYYHLRNKKRVPDNKDNFIYGSSSRMTITDAESYIKNIFSNAKYIYGHALKNDLEQLGVKVAGQIRFDTSTLHTKLTVAKEGIHTTRKTRLSKLCEIYTPELNDTPYHNAGNDIYVTGAILNVLADSDKVDSFVSELDDVEVINRTKQDEIERIIKIIPRLNGDLGELADAISTDFNGILNDSEVLDSILLMHQNIYRRMMRYGDKVFWSNKVKLGFVGDIFEMATPIQAKLMPNKFLQAPVEEVAS